MSDDLTSAQKRKMVADLAALQKMLGIPMGSTPTDEEPSPQDGGEPE